MAKTIDDNGNAWIAVQSRPDGGETYLTLWRGAESQTLTLDTTNVKYAHSLSDGRLVIWDCLPMFEGDNHCNFSYRLYRLTADGTLQFDGEWDPFSTRSRTSSSRPTEPCGAPRPTSSTTPPDWLLADALYSEPRPPRRSNARRGSPSTRRGRSDHLQTPTTTTSSFSMSRVLSCWCRTANISTYSGSATAPSTACDRTNYVQPESPQASTGSGPATTRSGSRKTACSGRKTVTAARGWRTTCPDSVLNGSFRLNRPCVSTEADIHTQSASTRAPSPRMVNTEQNTSGRVLARSTLKCGTSPAGWKDRRRFPGGQCRCTATLRPSAGTAATASRSSSGR